MLSEALLWMATAVQEFGLKQLDVKQLIEWMKADVNSTSAPVRSSAIALLGVAHRQLGPGLDPLLSQSVKPALMQTLRDAFKANPVEQVAPHHHTVTLCMPLTLGVEPWMMLSLAVIVKRALRRRLLAQVVPSRRVRGRAGAASQGAGGAPRPKASGSNTASAAAVSAEASDLLPRTDISGSITGRLADSFSRY